MTKEAALLPQSCSLFSEISDPTIPCQNCVSGPRLCPCSMPGECEIQEDNLLKVISGIGTSDECLQLCISKPRCTVFTFFGEENPLRHTCFLFKSCDDFINECPDCTSGTSQCDICDFED